MCDSVQISVIIPVYNAETFLSDTINSVLCQTFMNYELLLLDDESTDNSSIIIKEYNDSRIKYIHCLHNFIQTLNAGLCLAKGKYIALLDHDDLMMPNRLQTQFDFMEANPDIAACGGYMHSFGLHSTRMEVPLIYTEIVFGMVLGNPILNPTGFIRKEILISNNIYYQKGYSFAADFKFWSDVVKVGKVVNIPQILTLYRTSNIQTSVRYRKKSKKGAHKIQFEIVNYLLSLSKTNDNKLSDMLNEKLIPALNDLSDFSFFSAEIIFPFMYELIVGLYREGALDIS